MRKNVIIVKIIVLDSCYFNILYIIGNIMGSNLLLFLYPSKNHLKCKGNVSPPLKLVGGSIEQSVFIDR